MYITITYKNKHFLIRYDPPDYSEVASTSISKQNEVELQDAHQKGENKINTLNERDCKSQTVVTVQSQAGKVRYGNNSFFV